MKTIDKTEDMKETEFKPGEYCLFPHEEIQSILNLASADGYYDYAFYPDVSDCISIEFQNGKLIPNQELGEFELTREQFMFKATRGKGISTSAKNAQVEFDPEKPYEISFNFPDDEQVEWETGYHFIGFKKNGNIIVEREDGRLRAVAQIRNIFHAGMLKRGEFMIDEQGDIYTYVYSGCASSMNLRTNQTYGDLEGSKIRGKRVKLNITPEEI